MDAKGLENMTVKELIEQSEAAAGLLAELGIDSCCGGWLPLEEAAAAHEIPLAPLVKQLEKLLDPAAT